MGKSTDLSDFERGTVVGARLAGLSIAETVKLLGFHVLQFHGYTVNGVISEKQRLQGHPVDGRASLMLEVREGCHVSFWPTGGLQYAKSRPNQDNAPCHKGRIVMDWFEEHAQEFTLLQWPAQSPDLNPIEHLWDEVERAVRGLPVLPSNKRQLSDAVLAAWAGIPAERFQHLVESMPRRIDAVLRAKGGPTRY
jgi:hypothetical protein